MYRVLDRYSGKQFGEDCSSKEEAQKLAERSECAVVCDLSIPKEELAKRARDAWERFRLLKSQDNQFQACRDEWLQLDREYTALYDEEY